MVVAHDTSVGHLGLSCLSQNLSVVVYEGRAGIGYGNAVEATREGRSPSMESTGTCHLSVRLECMLHANGSRISQAERVLRIFFTDFAQPVQCLDGDDMRQRYVDASITAP